MLFKGRRIVVPKCPGAVRSSNWRVAQKVPGPPSLQRTLENFVKVFEALGASPSELDKAIRMSQSFSNGPGKILQRRLADISKSLDNWATDLGTQHSLLRNRDSLVYTNGVSCRVGIVAASQAQSAAAWAKFAVDFASRLDRETLFQAQSKLGPFCMDTMKKMIRGCRRPQKLVDVTVFSETKSYDLVVIRKGQIFTVPCTENVSEQSLRAAFETILQQARNDSFVSCLTALPRDRWAAAYEILKKNNYRNIETIESCIWILCLDDDALNPDDVSGNLLHGSGADLNGKNRWFDKCMQVVVAPDGSSDIMLEHSSTDGVRTRLTFLDFFSCNDRSRKNRLASPEPALRVERMEWDLSNLSSYIEEARDLLNKAASTLSFTSMKILDESSYHELKRQRVADACVQLALQLAFFREHGRVPCMYESVSLGHFFRGEQSNVRSNCPEAARWLLQMDCANSSVAKKRNLLQSALFAQKRAVEKVQSGLGIDDHMAALESLSGYLQLGQEFFDSSFYRRMMQFEVGSSQVADFQGSYSPMCPHGYGACYGFDGQGISTVVSSFRPRESEYFAENIRTALNDVFELIQTPSAVRSE